MSCVMQGKTTMEGSMRIGLTGFFTLFAVMPALASEVRQLPEPRMVGLVALGVAGAVIAARLKRRKQGQAEKDFREGGNLVLPVQGTALQCGSRIFNLWKITTHSLNLNGSFTD